MATVFIVDCPCCKAKVGVEEQGRILRKYWIDGPEEPGGDLLQIGQCPRCTIPLVGTSIQTSFDGYEGAEGNEFSDPVRVFPHPQKAFSSVRIPRVVTDSLIEADKSLQSGAHMAACVMFGRALEAVCRNILLPEQTNPEPVKKKRLMLSEGIRQLLERKVIDDRLFDWSQQLHAFRNLSAHPDHETAISRQDAEDLQIFVYAIIEYIYDLTDRYAEFKMRIAKRSRPPKARSANTIFGDE
jgi:hypothetical protein